MAIVADAIQNFRQHTGQLWPTLSVYFAVAECGLDYHVQVAEISNAGQGVWSFPVGTLQLMILSMCLNTQSPDRQQMGRVWPIFNWRHG